MGQNNSTSFLVNQVVFYTVYLDVFGFYFLIFNAEYPIIIIFLYLAKMIDTVYDVTVGYCDVVPEKGEMDIFRGNIPQEVQFLIHKYPISALPQNKEDLDNWCVEKWKEKERCLEKFYSGTKTFEGQEDGKLENLSGQAVYTVIFILAFWIYGVLISAWLMLTSPFVLWGSVVIMAAYVIIGKYFGGVDYISIASFNFTQDLTHKARTT